MTKEQSLFINILKSRKYRITPTNWQWLDTIANKLFRKNIWEENYKELFKNTTILNTCQRHSKNYREDLPFVDGDLLINFMKKTSLTDTISRLEKIFKGQ